MKKTVLFLCGGRSEEHEISLISTACALKALDRSRYEPLLIGISRKGDWRFLPADSFFDGPLRADEIKLKEGPTPWLKPPGAKAEGACVVEGKEYRFDIVFPLIHGTFGEDGTIQGLLEFYGIPFVGADTVASAVCFDKVLTKDLASQRDIPVAPYVVVRSLEDCERLKASIEKLGFPCFVKPAREGSSVGVSKVKDKDAVKAAVEAALAFDSKVLIEKGIQGREMECSVLRFQGETKSSLPGEIIPSPKIGWYSYEAKYLLADGAVTQVPADIDDETSERIRALAIRVFDLLECEGMARVDLFFETSTGALYLNEVNTVPGFTPISMYPKMWEATGLSYQDLISQLIESGLNR